jgi:ATP-dependent DNA helicase RecG
VTAAPSLAKLSVTALKGVGGNFAQTLARLNLHTVQDILFHLPLRYLDRTTVVPIGDLAPNTSVVIEGAVVRCDVVMGRRRSLLVTLRDETGQVNLRFFHFNAAQKAQFAVGAEIRCFGDPRLGSSGVELYHPEYEVIQPGAAYKPVDQSLTPVYPTTEGLSQARLRKLTAQAVDMMRLSPPAELLPREVNQQFEISSLSEALAYVHFPPKDAPIPLLLSGTHPYQQRLAFEEMLAHHLALQQSRALAHREAAPALPADPALLQNFYGRLPFALTSAQQRVIRDIHADMAEPRPMLRLVQGDVGSGKTLVAAAAALAAVGQNWQVALVAPTEILSEQHKRNFETWLAPLGFNVAWLVGRLTPKQKQAALDVIAQGTAQLVVGTHALFQENVRFARLGLVIIDEQHRFGVHQRLSLRDKSAHSPEEAPLRPHQLVMTATPIPRTLAMTAYADLDLSVIDELPPGRTPVNTVLVSQQRRADVIERVRSACREGRQAYWVCTLVEDSETLAAAAAEEMAGQLREALPELQVGLIHGRLKGREKEGTMARFKAGDLNLLVATTVIEVGVDVPNASLMIIENPERLGLAQLHQLRGRVGRGRAESHCVLLYGNPLSRVAKQRLQVMRSTNDGFVIAEQDLNIRGPGELLGTRQTGALQFRLADLQRDAHMIPNVQQTAGLIQSHHPQIADALIQRWFAHQQDYMKG